MTVAIIELDCALCGNKFNFELKYYKYRLKEDPNTKFYCSKECRFDSKKTGQVYSCANCGKSVYRRSCERKKKNKQFKNVFCSSSCNAAFNNKLIKRSDNTKTKLGRCINCGIDVVLHAHGSIDNVLCNSCREIRRKQIHKIKEIKCERCGITFLGQQARYCDSCRQNVYSEKGSRSAEKQAEERRSKAEILFANLCKSYFTNVLENKILFNNRWDADIALPDIKVAVLYNGIWHYKKITKKHSVKQVQNRDKIKFYEIIKAGYLPYVIKDLGKFNEKFVRKEFAIFINYLKARNLA